MSVHFIRKKSLPASAVAIESEQPQANLLAASQDLTTDQQVDQIMDMILERAVEYTSADAGSIYLVEQVAQDSLGGARAPHRHVLRFHKTKNVSASIIQTPERTGHIEISLDSIVGFTASTGTAVRVRDCYLISNEAPYKFNKEIDRQTGYRTKSVLTIPIKTNKNSVIGVLQLINKMRPYRRNSDKKVINRREMERDTIAFSENDEKLIQAFASHAAIALENAKLTNDIARLFESFVKASVSAIEARDPSTSGHSDRVARLTVDFAVAVDHMGDGPFRDIQFNEVQIREIRYAALLHDFGKIGVRENVLLKAKKLFPHELETILLRLDSIRLRNETKKWKETCERLANMAEKGKLNEPTAELAKTLLTVDTFNRELEEIRRGILVANESQILDKDFDIRKLMDWMQEMSQKLGQTIVTPHEAKLLSIARGTLSLEERLEIESHVSYTYEFLRQIAWTDDLSRVPDIAHAHHEKLDGTGYPRNLHADEIPVQSRMMAISDIFDALTAMDRPYKKAVSTDRALDILSDEARTGKLDHQLLKIFIEAEIYRSVIVSDTRVKKRAA